MSARNPGGQRPITRRTVLQGAAALGGLVVWVALMK